jgi:tRNA(fMet)-specific endonuclease VapC
MSYLLDTSTCIAMLRDRPPVVRARAMQAASRHQNLLVSSIVLHELWYGVYKSSDILRNASKLLRFLAGNLATVDFDNEDARIAGEIRAVLKAQGRLIGAFDPLIAAQCLRHNFTLVTADVSHFARISDLRWENWAT